MTHNIKKAEKTFIIAFDLLKTFWKIETANAIFWMYLGGTAKKNFFFSNKTFDVTWCMRRVVHVNKCCKHLNPILPHLDYITLAHNNHVSLFTIKFS